MIRIEESSGSQLQKYIKLDWEHNCFSSFKYCCKPIQFTWKGISWKFRFLYFFSLLKIVKCLSKIFLGSKITKFVKIVDKSHFCRDRHQNGSTPFSPIKNWGADEFWMRQSFFIQYILSLRSFQFEIKRTSTESGTTEVIQVSTVFIKRFPQLNEILIIFLTYLTLLRYTSPQNIPKISRTRSSWRASLEKMFSVCTISVRVRILLSQLCYNPINMNGWTMLSSVWPYSSRITSNYWNFDNAKK